MPFRLSGRLALSCLLGARSLTEDPVAVLLLSHPRVYGHRGGAGHCVLADCDVLWYLHRYRGRHGVPSLSRGVPFMSVVESFLSNLSFDGWSSVTCRCLGDWSFTAVFRCFLCSGISRRINSPRQFSLA